MQIDKISIIVDDSNNVHIFVSVSFFQKRDWFNVTETGGHSIYTHSIRAGFPLCGTILYLISVHFAPGVLEPLLVNKKMICPLMQMADCNRIMLLASKLEDRKVDPNNKKLAAYNRYLDEVEKRDMISLQPVPPQRRNLDGGSRTPHNPLSTFFEQMCQETDVKGCNLDLFDAIESEDEAGAADEAEDVVDLPSPIRDSISRKVNRKDEFGNDLPDNISLLTLAYRKLGGQWPPPPFWGK